MPRVAVARANQASRAAVARFALKSPNQIAQAIRDTAGPRVTPGTAATAGLRSSDAQLSARGAISITSAAAAAAAAESGAGTVADPYVIRGKVITASGSRGFQWTFTTTELHLLVVDCLFHDNTTSEVRLTDMHADSAVTFLNCEFYSEAANQDLIDLRAAANATFVRCLMSGAKRHGVVFQAGWDDTLTMADCQFDESRTVWTSAGDCIAVSGATDGTVDIDRMTIDAPNARCAFRFAANGVTVTIDRLDVTGCGYGFFDTSYSGTASGPITVTDSAFANCTDSNVNLRNINGLTLNHCEFGDTPDTVRCVYFPSNYVAATSLTLFPQNVTVTNCKVTKKSGDNAAGNEALQFNDPVNCTVSGTWITEAVEDAYEMLRPQGGCSVTDSVADNCFGQAVDIFQTQDVGVAPTTANGTRVERIYGKNVSHYGVIVTDSDHVKTRDIYLDTTAGVLDVVFIENRDADGFSSPDRCTVAGDISSATYAGSGVSVTEDVSAGPGNIVSVNAVDLNRKRIAA